MGDSIGLKGCGELASCLLWYEGTLQQDLQLFHIEAHQKAKAGLLSHAARSIFDDWDGNIRNYSATNLPKASKAVSCLAFKAKERTVLASQIHGLLGEYGIVIPKGIGHLSSYSHQGNRNGVS